VRKQEKEKKKQKITKNNKGKRRNPFLLVLVPEGKRGEGRKKGEKVSRPSSRVYGPLRKNKGKRAALPSAIA